MITSDDLNTCPLHYAISRIGGKWSSLILWHLSLDETRRYGELKRSVGFTMSHKMFSQQLKELEDYGLVNRYVYNELPLRVEYALTRSGRKLIPIIYALRDWGAQCGDFPLETKRKSTGVRVVEAPHRNSFCSLKQVTRLSG